jgi:non-ribosomal peptide synthetase component F
VLSIVRCLKETAKVAGMGTDWQITNAFMQEVIARWCNQTVCVLNVKTALSWADSNVSTKVPVQLRMATLT